MNTELVKLLLQLVIGAGCIMALIAVVGILTPKIARFIEKSHPSLKAPERVEDDDTPPEVNGPFDAQTEDYDLNDKVYNKDIYGVDFKHGKK